MSAQRVTPEFLNSELKQLDTWCRQNQGRPLPWILVKKFVEERLDQIAVGEIATRFRNVMPQDLPELKRQAFCVEEEVMGSVRRRPKDSAKPGGQARAAAQALSGKPDKSLAQA